MKRKMALFMALIAFAVFPIGTFLLSRFCFSMTIGVLWEFFEFAMDCFFHTDMQKDTVIHSIHTVTLDASRSNKVVSVEQIAQVQPSAGGGGKASDRCH